MTTRDAFKKVIYNGKLMDKKGRAFIQAAEEKLGYNLTIVQGNYNPGGVAQSAGTHDGGGVFDLAAWDWENKLRVIKDLGGWGWYRATVPGLWNEHIHFGITNHGTLSKGAQNQQKAYYAKRNGLVSNLMDNSYRAPGNPIFKYPVKPTPPPPTNVSKARDEIVEALHAAGEAKALLMAVPKSRTVVWDRIEELSATRQELRQLLKSLPKR